MVQVSLEEPQVPAVHRVGQALVRVEDESQRYMPRQASLEEGTSPFLTKAPNCRYYGAGISDLIDLHASSAC